MKKKISVFALLLSFLLAVLVPVQVKADDIDSDTLNAIKLLVDNDTTSALLSSKYYLIGYDELGDFLTVCFYDKENVVCIKGDTLNAPYVYLSTSYSNWNKATGEKYVFNNGNWEYYSKGSVSIAGKTYPTLPTIFCSSFSEIYDYYGKVIVTDIPAIEDLLTYNFVMWCSDAGLNCQASSNESDSVIPYSYNDYWHIVRKTNTGKWLLTTIGSTIGQSKMNLRSSDSGDFIIYEFSGDDSFVISVREYVYDTDGWKLRSYDTYDYYDFSSGLLTLPAGSGIDDTRVLAYTSTDIYSSDGLSVYVAASTEYIEPSVPDVTPEPTPGSGSSGSGDSDNTGSDDSGSSGGGRPGSGTRPSLGGEASGGGGLDFIINLFTLLWTTICAVPMSVDGYSISLQQLYVYGALISIVGGFIIKFIFRR